MDKSIFTAFEKTVGEYAKEYIRTKLLKQVKTFVYCCVCDCTQKFLGIDPKDIQAKSMLLNGNTNTPTPQRTTPTFRTLQEAKEVLEMAAEYVEQNKQLSVYDWRTMCSIPTSFAQKSFGWNKTEAFMIINTNDGMYEIATPIAIKLY